MSVFQSKAWQSAWWETWGRQKGFRLIRKWDGEVSGVYESQYRFKGLLPIRSLQFVGTSYRELRTPRTEYNRFFNGRLGGQALFAALQELLEDHSWTEVVFTDLCQGSEELSALVALAAQNKWGFRINAVDDGYAVDASGTFSDYLASLGSNTRLRIYNRRKLFETLGRVKQENLWPSSPDSFFQHLNRFHRNRWEKDCVSEKSLEFHKKFLSRVEMEGGRPILSTLAVDDEIVSVLYNVWFRGVVYNIQAGFIEAYHKKISLGSLHLGYAIEDAFNCPDTRRLDLLAGQGKNEDYKMRIATDAYQFLSIMLVKSVPFRALYRMKG